MPDPSPEKKEAEGRLSIVIPSFNQGAYLEAAIRSVLDQDWPEIELIVIDGGSTDGSVEILRAYGDRLAYWESAPDRGQSEALNKGFARATGGIMAWLCADDAYLPGALREIAFYFQQHPDCLALYGDGQKVDQDDKLIDKIMADEPDPDNLHNWCGVFTPACFWRRGLWDAAGAHVDETLTYTMDWELMLRFRRLAAFHKISFPITSIREHAGSKSAQAGQITAAIKQRGREIAKISRKYGGLFCFNSLAYESKKISTLAKHLPAKPAWLARAGFIALHLPLSLIGKIYGRPKSNLVYYEEIWR